jgi:hypothetical protein
MIASGTAPLLSPLMLLPLLPFPSLLPAVLILLTGERASERFFSSTRGLDRYLAQVHRASIGVRPA